MLSKSTIFLFAFSLLSTTTVLAVEANAETTKDSKLNLFDMKRRLEDQNRKIISLTKEMNKLELELGMQNKKYLKQADSRTKLEEALNIAKKNIDLDSANLKKNYNETKAILMGLLLNKLEKTESPSDLLARKVLITNLQTRMVELDGLMRSNKNVEGGVNDLYKRLESSVQTEKDLVAIMNDLEQKKKDIKQAIMDENARRDQYSTEFDELKNKLAIEKDTDRRSRKKEQLKPVQVTEEIKIPSHGETQDSNQNVSGGGYRAPLYSHSGIEYNQKGVTFKFQGKNEVLATRPGKIVYTGSLANYGNVIMIDHGNDTRTVLLGQFDAAVKNGEMVKESQVLGYTNPRSANGIGDGKIYFEVRKNNLAQNTYLLLDKKTLVKSASR